MYKDNDNRGEGHLCIRDLTHEAEDLKKRLSTKEQTNQTLDNKIKQLQSDVKERDALISKMCEDHDSTVANNQVEKMGILNKERQNLQSKLNQLREELSFSQ